MWDQCDIEDQSTTNDRPLFLEEPSWKNFKQPYLCNSARDAWSQWTTHRKSTAGSRMVTWPMTSCDPKKSRSCITPLFLKRHISVSVPDRHMCGGITRQMTTSLIDHYWNFFLSVLKIGQYYMNFGETISNNDFDVSHYWYIIKLVSIRRRVSNSSQKKRKSS